MMDRGALSHVALLVLHLLSRISNDFLDSYLVHTCLCLFTAFTWINFISAFSLALNWLPPLPFLLNINLLQDSAIFFLFSHLLELMPDLLLLLNNPWSIIFQFPFTRDNSYYYNDCLVCIYSSAFLQQMISFTHVFSSLSHHSLSCQKLQPEWQGLTAF